MSSPPPAASMRVAVVDCATPVGSAVVEVLDRSARRGDGPVGEAIAIAATRGAPRTASWRLADPTTPQFAQALEGVDALVWAVHDGDLESRLKLRASQRREATLAAARALVAACVEAGVRRLVAITSAQVYGASPMGPHPDPIAEDAALQAEDEGAVGDLLAVEQLLAEAGVHHPGLDITILRPAALVGGGVDTMTTRHFEAPRLLVVRGARMRWQFLHVEDLGAAVLHLLGQPTGRAAGAGRARVVTAAAEGSLSQQELERLTGMRRVEVSESVALGTAQRLHRVGVLPTPATDLRYAIHPWVVASPTLDAAGWRPTYDNAACVGVLLDGVRGRHAVAGRRVDSKEAALGAASAAVALVGTAAVLRRTRRSG